jgi:hypothetical protein
MALGVDSASKRNEYQESSWRVMVWPERKADNLTAICETIVYKMWQSRVSQPYGSSRPVTGIALSLPFYYR